MSISHMGNNNNIDNNNNNDNNNNYDNNTYIFVDIECDKPDNLFERCKMNLIGPLQFAVEKSCCLLGHVSAHLTSSQTKNQVWAQSCFKPEVLRGAKPTCGTRLSLVGPKSYSWLRFLNECGSISTDNSNIRADFFFMFLYGHWAYGDWPYALNSA